MPQYSVSLTESTDTKEADSLFSHRYLYLAPSTSIYSKNIQSLALLTPDIPFKRGAQLHLCHCQSENGSELQAHGRGANQ